MVLSKGLNVLFTGRAEQSMEWFDRVLEIHNETPHTVDIAKMWKALAYFARADYGSALSQLKDIGSLRYVRSRIGAASFAQLGQGDK